MHTSLRRARVTALLLAFAASTTAAQITPEQITSLQTVGSVAMSPDGRWVAYTLAQPRAAEEDTLAGLRGYSEVWVVPASGGQPVALVRRPNSAGNVSWTPAGELSFARSGQVHVAPVSCFTATTPCETRTIAGVTGVIAYHWSPDGQWIAWTARVPEAPEVVERRRRGQDVIVATEINRPVRLWVRRVTGGEPVALTPATQSAKEFAWAPDSRTLAVQIAEKSDADADLMYRRIDRVTTDGAAPTLLTRTQGKLGAMAWSPDGTRLAYMGAVSFNDPLAQTVFVATPGGAATNLTPDYEGSVLWLDWQDPRTVRFVAAEGTKTALNTVPAAGGSITREVGPGAEIFQSATFARDGAAFAVPASTAMHPNEVHVGSMRDRRLRRVTNHNAFLSSVRLGAQETVRWTARDGWTIEGVLIRPTGAPAGRAPLAILPHGGPEGISYDGWVTNSLYPAQLLAGAGYAVLMPN